MIRNLFSAGVALVGLLGLVQMAAAQAPVVMGAGCPCPDACPEKVCRRVTETKTVTERKYSDTCEDYCRPKCSWLLGFCGGGCDCADSCCGSVHTKKFLVIHFPKHDECVSKCVPVVVEPACAAPCISPAPMIAPRPATPPPPPPKVGAMMMPSGQAQQWPR